MLIKKCGDEIIKGEKSIFLMGPVSKIRKDENWYDEALNCLEECGYDGVVYVPYNDLVRDTLEINIWRIKALNNSNVACFWVPRKNPDMLGLDVNILFGQCLNSDKLIYGRPDGSYKTDDLDKMYFILRGEEPFSELNKLISAAVDKANLLYSMDRLNLIDFLARKNPNIFIDVAKSLSKEELNYIKDNLEDIKTCPNCTSYCIGGLSNGKCPNWHNDEIIGRAKVIGTLK